MNILIMAQHYSPEEVSGAVLATELAEDMMRRGNQVTIVTCAPNYPLGKVYGGYKNKLRFIEIINHVRVVRVWSYITSSKRNWKRVVNYGTFSLSAFYGGILAGKPDVIFSYSPPLPLGISVWLLSRLWKVPWILRVEDLYPDAAIAAGVLRNNQLISMLKALEGFIYRKASHISLISEGFRRNLVEKGVVPEKLSVTPLWSDQNAIIPQEKENHFKAAQGLSNQFVIQYAGNLGLTSSLEDILHSAELLKGCEEIHYMFVGEGVKKEALIQYANDHGLNQVHFLPYQPRSMLSDVLAVADISLVTLNPASSRYSMPNKIFNIMASGRPVLVIAPRDSDLAQLVQLAECGICVPPDSPHIIAETILSLMNNPILLDELGNKGRAYLEGHYSRQRCMDEYEALLKRVARC